jgi:uncharacterized protein YbjQ (UPF0145 family)
MGKNCKINNVCRVFLCYNQKNKILEETNVIIMTTEHINKDFEVLGLVRGSMIQSKHLGRDMMAGFKTLVGGELKGYTQMMEESREQALRRMSSQADTLGADAIIGMRFTSSSLMQGAAEITAYGTAIKYK